MNISINTFPDELLINIFSYLEPKELADTALVSKKWKALSCDNMLWANLIKRMPIELKYDETGIKHALNKIRKITNYYELMEDFQTFSEGLDQNQKAQYDCLFLKNPSCYLNIKFGMINDETKATEVFRQVLFTKQLVQKASLIYGNGKVKSIQGKLPSKYPFKELNRNDDIFNMMTFLYDQIRKTEFNLLVHKTSIRTQNNASYIATAFTVGFIAICFFALATYRNFYLK